MEYEDAIEETLVMCGLASSTGSYNLDVLEFGTLTLSFHNDIRTVRLFSSGTFTNFSELSDEVQTEIYNYIFDNRFNLRFECRENLVEVGSTENMDWVVAPCPMMMPADDGSGEEVCIGSLAISKEMQEDGKELRSVLLIAPDGTWATLSCFVADEVQGTTMAKLDVMRLSQELQRFIDKF